jgi:AmiR/NasT family two-component response regulator
MEATTTTRDPAKSDARMLDRAEGVLMALRRCTIDAAFDEIVDASKRHHVPPLRIAKALVSLAAAANVAFDDDATAAARYEWGELFQR